MKLPRFIKLWWMRRKYGKHSTKFCPRCGNDEAIMLLTTMNEKRCYICLHRWQWRLDKGQKKLL